MPQERAGWLGQYAPGTRATDLSPALLWCRCARPQPPTPTQASEQNGVAGAECTRIPGLGRVEGSPVVSLCLTTASPLRGRKASIRACGSSGSVRLSRSPSRQPLWPELSPPSVRKKESGTEKQLSCINQMCVRVTVSLTEKSLVPTLRLLVPVTLPFAPANAPMPPLTGPFTEKVKSAVPTFSPEPQKERSSGHGIGKA